MRIQIKQTVSRPLSFNERGVYPAAELYRLRLKRFLPEKKKHNRTGKMNRPKLSNTQFSLLNEMYG